MLEIQGYFEVEIWYCALIGNLTLLDLVPYICIYGTPTSSPIPIYTNTKSYSVLLTSELLSTNLKAPPSLGTFEYWYTILDAMTAKALAHFPNDLLIHADEVPLLIVLCRYWNIDH